MLFIFALSLTLSLCLAPLAGLLAKRLGLLDRPANHKYHAQSTPLLGGAALFVGLVIPVGIATPNAEESRLWVFLGTVGVLFLVGLWDDWRHLPIVLRLGIQMAAALALLAGGLTPQLPLPDWTAFALSLLWIIGITNAINLLDNMDGATTGVTAVAAAGFLALDSGSQLTQILAAALLGTSLGFLPHNFYRARLFMGDAGSLVLGFSLATLGLEAKFDGVDASQAWMLPVLILAVPIFDTTLVTFSRLRQGKNPMTHPGKDHFAHRLARCGLSVRDTVISLYALSLIGSLLALLICRGAPAWGIGLVVAVTTTFALAWLERSALTG